MVGITWPTSIFDAHGRAVVRLGPNQADALQALFEECEDYFDLVFGLPPGPAEVQSAFIGIPEGISYDDKFLLGVVEDDRLVGHLDVVRGYPKADAWTIGLFLLAPDARTRGLGAAIADTLFEWLALQRAQVLRMPLVAWNERGRIFLIRLGFTCVETYPDHASGTKRGDLLILERPISSP